jgi:hypothetical protein
MAPKKQDVMAWNTRGAREREEEKNHAAPQEKPRAKEKGSKLKLWVRRASAHRGTFGLAGLTCAEESRRRRAAARHFSQLTLHTALQLTDCRRYGGP